MWNLKKLYMNLFTKQKTTDVENKLMVIRGKWRGGMKIAIFTNL